MSSYKRTPQDQPVPNSLTSPTARDSSISADASGQAAQWNPVSKWQESVVVPGLTLFDIHRDPRRASSDESARVRVQLKVLSPEFHCSVCLSYIKNTRIVKECLHRFCNDCIEKCLRIGMRECPQCRIHIPSRRSLRPDVNFDNLIKSIYGDIEKLEKYEEEEVARANKKTISDGKNKGVLQRNMQKNKRRNSASADNAAAQANSSLIDFILRRHPQETLVDSLKREYVRTSQEMTVENLKVYLGKKLGYSQYSHFQILTIAGEKAVALPDDITLGLIRRDIFNNPDSELIIYYRIFPR